VHGVRVLYCIILYCIVLIRVLADSKQLVERQFMQVEKLYDVMLLTRACASISAIFRMRLTFVNMHCSMAPAHFMLLSIQFLKEWNIEALGEGDNYWIECKQAKVWR
jgi:hypothetical protein